MGARDGRQPGALHGRILPRLPPYAPLPTHSHLSVHGHARVTPFWEGGRGSRRRPHRGWPKQPSGRPPPYQERRRARLRLLLLGQLTLLLFLLLSLLLLLLPATTALLREAHAGDKAGRLPPGGGFVGHRERVVIFMKAESGPLLMGHEATGQPTATGVTGEDARADRRRGALESGPGIGHSRQGTKRVHVSKKKWRDAAPTPYITWRRPPRT